MLGWHALDRSILSLSAAWKYTVPKFNPLFLSVSFSLRRKKEGKQAKIIRASTKKRRRYDMARMKREGERERERGTPLVRSGALQASRVRHISTDHPDPWKSAASSSSARRHVRVPLPTVPTRAKVCSKTDDNDYGRLGNRSCSPATVYLYKASARVSSCVVHLFLAEKD